MSAVVTPTRYNEALMDILESMADIRAKEGEPFKAKAFKNAHDNLVNIDKNINSCADLKGIPGFGTSVLTICDEFVSTGHVRIIDDFKNNPINLFSNVYGIGPKNAVKLVSSGITSLAQLQQRAMSAPGFLNDKQMLGLKYYDDIMARIPRNVVDVYNVAIRAQLPAGTKMDVVGSYRRGAATSGDIDIIFTCIDRNVSGVALNKLFELFINNLIASQIILKSHILAYGDSKCLVIAKVGSDNYYRRIDFLCAPPSEYAASLLYFTGSKYFNTVMRQWAVDRGLTMNEHGIYRLGGPDGRQKGALVDAHFDSEMDIFNYLGLVYVPPVERKDGRDVRPVSGLVACMRRNGISSLSGADVVALIQAAKYNYYNIGTAILTDSEYDALESYAIDRKLINGLNTGADVVKDEITLPFLAPSLSKIKPDTNALAKWKSKYRGPYVVSCKLDGCSILLFDLASDGSATLTTRGNGAVGQDVSYLLPYLSSTLAAGLNKLQKGTCIRGELIVKRNVFDSKYATTFANIRNMIAGILNRKSVDAAMLSDVDAVFYEVISPIMKPSDQMLFLERGGFNVVWYSIVPDVTNNSLSALLVDKRANYEYDNDGLVVVNDQIAPRISDNKDKTPDNAFAFKMVLEDQQAEVIVNRVNWNPSKDGYLKGMIYYDPVTLGGVECKSATLQNAAFVRDNRIGVGSKLRIWRSGDVVPNVLEALSPAVVTAMPDEKDFGSFHWSETGVDLILDNPSGNVSVLVNLMLRFFSTLDVPGLKEGTIVRLIESGFDTIPKILAMSRADLLKVRGFKDKSADNLYNGLRVAINRATLVDLMIASNMFGRGFGGEKINYVMRAYPNLLKNALQGFNRDAIINQLINVPGIGNKSALLFVDGIGPFLTFLRESGLLSKLNESGERVGVAVASSAAVRNSRFPVGKNIVFSGPRDAEFASFKELCAARGVEIADSLTQKSAVLIVQDPTNITTGKAVKAREKNIPIMTIQQFVDAYF